MDNQRRIDLRESLERALQSETQQRDLDVRGRIVWLAEQMDEYIERWLGFCAVRSLPMPSLVQSDLFGAIEIGAEVLGTAIGNSDVVPNARSAWNIFLATLVEVSNTSNKLQAQRLKETFRVFRIAVEVG